MTRALLAALLALAACESAPEFPTYRQDVKPIIDANCARCHGLVPRSGAPDTFRLDIFGVSDFVYDDGRAVIGASLLSGHMSVRAHSETMPPNTTLSDRQLDILDRWADGFNEFAEPERGEPRPGNQLPEIELVDPIAVDADGFATIRYRLSDDDFEIAGGTLTAVGPGGEIQITRELYSGQGTVVWDTAVVEPGTYELRAELDDGQERTTAVLDTIELTHANRAPSVSFISFGEGELVANLPFDVEVVLADDDNRLTVELFAVRGDDPPISLRSLNVQLAGPGTLEIATIPITDLTGVTPGPDWRLRAVASDGLQTREAISLPFVAGDPRREGPSFAADVSPVLGARCGPCHGPDGYAPVGAIWSDYENAGTGPSGQAGLIYRYVVQTQTMPPGSAEHIDFGFTYEPMTAAERQLVADWILAGAQDN